MKTFYTLLFGFAVISAYSQTNLVLNPGFEELNLVESHPTQWGTYIVETNNIGSLTVESNDVHSGLHAVKMTSLEGLTHVLRSQNIGGAASSGATFSLSFWYKDEGNAKTKFKFQWFNSLTELTTDTFEGEYLPNTTGWQQVTATGTAPVGTNRFRLRFFIAGESSGNQGSILFDDVSLTTGALDISKNEISGLQLYPNPVTNGNLRIETSVNAEKAIAVYDLLGKQVFTTKLQGSDLDVSGIKPGVYILKVVEADKTSTSKLVIQ